MKLKLGVIGAGSWALASHLPNLARRRDDVEFTAVCRKGADTLEWIARTYGFTVASEDYTAVLDAGVDIVLVSSPTAWHYEHARAALLAGAHVLVEKPFTLTAAQAWELTHLARRMDKHLLVAFGYNYRPLVRASRAALSDAGGVGAMESLSVSMASVCRELLAGRGSYPKADRRAQPDPQTWNDPLIAGGGYAQAQASHALGLALHLFDVEPRQVYAVTSDPLGGGVESHLSAVVGWADGSHGTLSGSATHEGADANRDVLRVVAIGSDGQFRLDMDADRYRYYRRDIGELGTDLAPGAGAYECDGPPDALVDLALGRSDVNLSPGALGARTVEVIEALYRSAASGLVERCYSPGEAAVGA